MQKVEADDRGTLESGLQAHAGQVVPWTGFDQPALHRAMSNLLKAGCLVLIR